MNIQMKICPNCFFVPYEGGRCPQCGYTATETAEGAIALPPGTILDARYLLGRLLGLGGFGVTYLALDTVTQTTIAIKEYYPSSLAVREDDGTMKFNGKGDVRIFDHGMRAFIREAKSLQNFIGEKSIVQISHSFYENGTAYFVMEYLNGINLKVLRKSMGGRIPVHFAFDILLTLTTTLGQIHEAGLLHRDVSPENIFVTNNGDIKIIDFGATRYYVGDESQSLAIVLKPGFAPPEQYTSKGEQGPWTDVYALAATFYQSVSGQRVPDAPDRLAGNPTRPLCDLAPEIDKKLSAVIDRALALNFRKRYRSMQEFETALLKYGGYVKGEKLAETIGGDVQTRDSSPESPPISQRPNIAPEAPPVSQRPNIVPEAPPISQRPNLAPEKEPPAPETNNEARPKELAAVQTARKPNHRFKVAGTPYIIVTKDGVRGGKWAIPYNAEIRIGRKAGANHIVIPDEMISREHCVVRYDQKNGVFFLRDVSTNGTFSERGERYEKGKDAVLVPGSGFYLVRGHLYLQIGLE